MLPALVILHWIVVVFAQGSSSAYKILVLSPITAPSHTDVVQPLVRALADRGHSITYWSGLKGRPQVSNNNNFRILYSPALDRINSEYEIGLHDTHFPLLFDFPARMENYCAAIYQDPVFHQLMTESNDERYDLVIIEGLFNDCVLPLVPVFDVPFIYVNSFAPTPPWLLDAVGSPLAHSPNSGFGFTGEVNFWQRTFNIVSGLVAVYFRHWFVVPVVDRVASKMLSMGDGNVTSVEEIEDRYLSLVMTNTHFSIDYNLQTSDAVVHIGGIHCVPPMPLPSELKSFVDGSGDAGFVVVNFGSIFQGAGMPGHIRGVFLKAFTRLAQRVVWKWEDESQFEGDHIPANVRLLSWLPQQDLLGHPKARLFINHEGLNINQEAVYHGVPFIALPVFSDYPLKAQKAETDHAVRLDWNNLTEETLYDTIQLVMSDPRYAMKEMSAVMRDQTEGPLERAVYWTEYVVRHRGAPHLNKASRKLSTYQRVLFDVALVSLVSSLLSLYILLRLCLLRSKRNSTATNSRSIANKLKDE